MSKQPNPEVPFHPQEKAEVKTILATSAGERPTPPRLVIPAPPIPGKTAWSSAPW